MRQQKKRKKVYDKRIQSNFKSNLKLSIKTPMDFAIDSYLSKLLEFGDKYSYFTIKTNEKKSAENFPKLRPFDGFEIHCNFVEPSITNHISDSHKHDETEILYSSFHNVDYKHKISETPNKIHYVPIIKDIKRIKDIIISIQNEKGNLLKNEGANNIVYLNLKAF